MFPSCTKVEWQSGKDGLWWTLKADSDCVHTGFCTLLTLTSVTLFSVRTVEAESAAYSLRAQRKTTKQQKNNPFGEIKPSKRKTKEALVFFWTKTCPLLVSFLSSYQSRQQCCSKLVKKCVFIISTLQEHTAQRSKLGFQSSPLRLIPSSCGQSPLQPGPDVHTQS